MTTLERTCRLLLRSYPAEYRKERGEEIIGTLLEATPPWRYWPFARDAGALVLAGLHARAARNRRLTTSANLRIAVLTGAAAYLAFIAASDLTFGAFVLMRAGRAREPDWLQLLAGALVLAAVALVWVSRSRAVRLAGPVAAAVAVCVPPAIAGAGTGEWVLAWPVAELACLAVLAVLAARGERPGWRIAVPVALVGAFPVVGYLVPRVLEVSFLALIVAVGAISLLWVVIDARPAVAAGVFLLALWLPIGIANLVGFPDIGADVPLFIVIALAAIAVWRLHRQSARVPRANP